MTNYVLLTGAGFSSNFGGFLAKDMFNFIYNDIRCTENIREGFLRDFHEDYEYAYTAIKNKFNIKGSNILKFNDDDFQRFDKIIEDVYGFLNKNIYTETIKYTNRDIENTNSEDNLLKLTFANIIMPFIQNKGYFITLNQDLLLETIIAEHTLFLNSDTHLIYPGLNVLNGEENTLLNYKLRKHKETYDIKLTVNLGTTDHTTKLNCEDNNIPYLKIHGSSHWYDKDKKQLKLFGTDKLKQTEDNEYFKLFATQLNKVFSSKTKLLVIGYSFSDENINNILYSNLNNIDMTVIDVMSPADFFNKRLSPYCFDVKNLRYFSLDLKTLLYNTQYKNLLRQSFWER